jgi:predicted PurR-regulated permease PerM
VSGLYLARAFLMPVVLALLLRLVLAPIVRALKARAHVPEPLGAALLLAALLGVGMYGAYRLAGPAAAWLDSAPESLRRIETKLRTIRKPVEQVSKAADRVESMATGTDPDQVPAVTIKPTSLRDRLFSRTSGMLTAAGMTIVLLFFLLASGDLFLRKVVRVLPTLDDKILAIEVARSIEYNISRYLLSVTLVNVAMGCLVAVAMWLIGMPNPPLWGVMVAALSYVPYVGPLTSATVLLLVGVLTYDDLGRALVAPGIYMVLDALSSNFVIPIVLGRQLELNTVVIFLAVSFWTWLWGIPGTLLAVPLLAVVKILCDAFEPLKPMAEMLSD